MWFMKSIKFSRQVTDTAGGKQQGVKKSNSLPRGKPVREILRSDSSKQRLSSESTSVSHFFNSSQQRGDL